jgi:hypothetical protein
MSGEAIVKNESDFYVFCVLSNWIWDERRREMKGHLHSLPFMKLVGAHLGVHIRTVHIRTCAYMYACMHVTLSYMCVFQTVMK